MFKFDFDIGQWVFPFCFRLDLVGNRYRPWTFMFEILCFKFIICIDEDSR